MATKKKETIPSEIKNYLVEQSLPIVSVQKVVQIYLTRTTAEEAVFRTDHKTLSSASTFEDSTFQKKSLYVKFSGRKQKAVENRAYSRLVHTYSDLAGMPEYTCYHKDNLCLSCPRCILFGATETTGKDNKTKANILHRINYSAAYSVTPFEKSTAVTLFNSIDEMDNKPGQAFADEMVVLPGVVFPSIITLKNVTWEELVLVIKTLSGRNSYGANAGVMGKVINDIVGFSFSYDEITTSLEYGQAIRSGSTNYPLTTQTFLQRTKQFSSDPHLVYIPDQKSVDAIVEQARNTVFDKTLTKKIFDNANKYRKYQSDHVTK